MADRPPSPDDPIASAVSFALLGEQVRQLRVDMESRHTDNRQAIDDMMKGTRQTINAMGESVRNEITAARAGNATASQVATGLLAQIAGNLDAMKRQYTDDLEKSSAVHQQLLDANADNRARLDTLEAADLPPRVDALEAHKEAFLALQKSRMERRWQLLIAIVGSSALGILTQQLHFFSRLFGP